MMANNTDIVLDVLPTNLNSEPSSKADKPITHDEATEIDEKQSSIVTEDNLQINSESTDVEHVPISVFKLGPQVLAAVSVSIGSMVVGFVSAYSSPALASMAAKNETIVPTPDEQSWIGSLMPLCALIGGVAGGPLIQIMGRRNTILSTAIPFIISGLLIALAVDIPMIYVGRAISGLCVGIASLCLPVYLGEVLQPEVRGMLGLLPTTIGNIGMLLCYTAGKFIDWSSLAFLGAAIPVPFFILMFLIPETPRWYISKNKKEQARKSLQWLRGKDVDIKEELASIENAHISDQTVTNDSKFDLLKPSNMQLVSISIGLMFFQQMSGINAIIFYTVMIFESAGSTLDKYLCTIIVGIVNFAATFIASLLIDRLGRKILLFASGGAMLFSLTILGAFFYFKNNGFDVGAYGVIPLASLVVFAIGFSFGYGPVPWLMMGEILPAKIRSTAASIVTGFNWTCTFVVTKTFNGIIATFGEHGAFWMYASFCFVGLFFVFFCVPETRGKSLEDIEKLYNQQIRTRKTSVDNVKSQSAVV